MDREAPVKVLDWAMTSAGSPDRIIRRSRVRAGTGMMASVLTGFRGG